MSITVTYDLTPEQVTDHLQLPRKGPVSGLMIRILRNSFVKFHVRRSGPTTVEVSSSGIRVERAGSAQEVDWSLVKSLYERPEAWVWQLTPSGVDFIPKSAVPADEQETLSAQLREWAGAKYVVRKH